jgi:curved DNA-binding protein
MEYKDYYKIMGVARDASADDIKRAHRKLARKYHPDVSKEKNAEVLFKDLSEAYEVLRDPEKRAAYDRLGSSWRAGQDFRAPPDWDMGTEHARRGFGRKSTGTKTDFDADFSDFFDTLFRQDLGQGFRTQGADGSRRSTAKKPARSAFAVAGQDHQAKIGIDLEDAYSGASKTVTLRVPQVDAQGQVRESSHQISFDIPRGIRPGQRIRLAGQGSPGTDGGPAGDLYLEVEFRPRPAGKPAFQIDKHDVYLDLPVAPWEAALGASIEAPTPTGPVELTIPPGSQAGRKLRLRGRGIPGSTPGDFYFVLKITPPPADNEPAQSFYKRMADQFKGFNPRAGWQ